MYCLLMHLYGEALPQELLPRGSYYKKIGGRFPDHQYYIRVLNLSDSYPLWTRSVEEILHFHSIVTPEHKNHYNGGSLTLQFSKTLLWSLLLYSQFVWSILIFYTILLILAISVIWPQHSRRAPGIMKFTIFIDSSLVNISKQLVCVTYAWE